jgi:hypothetical protein
LHVAALVASTIIGGWLLACFVTSFSFEMPVLLYRFIRLAINVSGRGELDNPEDIQTLGLICLIVACWLFTAVLLKVSIAALRHRRSRRL